MKSFFFKLFLLVAVSTLSTGTLFAQYEWEEWPTNPLAIHGAPGSWDESVVTPCVIFNSDLNRYEMWYGTYDGTYPNNGIGFAWSTDGITWTKHPTAVMTPSGTGWEAVSVGECSVIKEGNLYKMWYTGHPNSTRTPSYIGYATSTDGGITWQKYAGNPVLSPGTGWEAARVEFPSVIKVTGGYWMFYTGELAHTIARTGRAFSTDGINWQKDTVNNPVLLPGAPGEWDENNYLGNVIELNNTLYIYYTANPGVGGTAIGVAASTDMGITWTKYSGNPIIQQGTTGQWDDGWIETGCAVFAHNQLRLYYDGGSPSTGWLGRIGLAISDPLPAGTYSIGTNGNFATIQDAFNKLETDGVAGNVTLELIDDLYTAPTDSFGFRLVGPIVGAGSNSRVTIRPAQNKNVTLEGNGRNVLFFMNTSYVTLDGVDLSGTTTLSVHSFTNTQFDINNAVGVYENSDYNNFKNLIVSVEDYLRSSRGIFITGGTNPQSVPDSNLIIHNFIKKAGVALLVDKTTSNIIKANDIGSETDSLISWGIQSQRSLNTLIEENHVQNLRFGIAYECPGIDSYLDNGCIIRNNVVHNIDGKNAVDGGFGIELSGDNGNPGINNMVYNNMVYDIRSASNRAAGIQLWYVNNSKIYYNTVYLFGNGTGTTANGSAALYISHSCTTVEAKNNILVNTRDESPYYASAIYDYSASNLTSDYNDLYANNYLVRIGGTNYTTLADWQATGKDLNSITEMPHFVDPYLHINPSALTQINSGAFPIAEVISDFDGDLRNQLNPDIGADEFLLLLDTLYVPQEYATIQAAIDAAVAENLVLVDDGTYVENINFKGKAITVASRFFIDGDETHIANTVIDGSQPIYPDSASVVTFRSGEDTTSIICGFTIRGGTGTSVLHEAMIKRLGGGVFIYFSDANIRNNIIELNHIEHVTDSWGGGIAAYTENSNHYIIENNIIQDNTINTPIVAGYSLGGGIYTGTFGYVRIVNNKVLDNTITASTAYGGGILPANFGGGSYFILGNVISGNNIYASTGGSGGIDIYNHSPVIKNNLIINNVAPLGGGAIIENATPIFANNTIAYNTATISGGGLEIVSPVPEIMNSILWGNSAQIGSQINGTGDVSYCDVEGGYTGTGNLNIDPLFRDVANGDFHLQSTDCGYGLNSPCIDAGNPAYEDWPLSCDWGLGQVRSDMGAFGGMNSVVEVPEEEVGLASDYVLYQNYPNPFNPSTTFKYSIPTQSKVVIKVYDILGNEVATLMDEEKPVGTYELTWNAATMPSGVYFYQLKAGEFVSTKKMILLK